MIMTTTDEPTGGPWTRHGHSIPGLTVHGSGHVTIPRSTPLDRARALARKYRADLTKRDPARAHLIDLAATAAGEYWVTDVTTGPTVCTTTEAAHLLGVTDRRIRQLIATGDLPTAAHDKRGYLLYVAAVINHHTARNRLVADHRTSGVPSRLG